jgi:hypothetical protein
MRNQSEELGEGEGFTKVNTCLDDTRTEGGKERWMGEER